MRAAIRISGIIESRRLNVSPSSPLPLECNRNEHASNPPGTFDEARAFLFPRFIYLFALRIFAIPLYPTVCPRNFFVVRRDVIGEVGSFQRIIKNFEKYLCRSCFDEKRAIIPRISSQANLFPLSTSHIHSFLEFNNKVSNFSLQVLFISKYR